MTTGEENREKDGASAKARRGGVISISERKRNAWHVASKEKNSTTRRSGSDVAAYVTAKENQNEAHRGSDVAHREASALSATANLAWRLGISLGKAAAKAEKHQSARKNGSIGGGGSSGNSANQSSARFRTRGVMAAARAEIAQAAHDIKRVSAIMQRPAQRQTCGVSAAWRVRGEKPRRRGISISAGSVSKRHRRQRQQRHSS